MAISLHYDDDPESILSALFILHADWPALDLFQWAQGDTLREKAQWVSESAHWWAVWDGDTFLGTIAAESHGARKHGERWALHFASRRKVNHQKVFLRCWRLMLRVFAANRVSLLVAYIPEDRAEIHRFAKVLKFRKFGNLWARRRLQNSILHQNRLLSSLPKTKK